MPVRFGDCRFDGEARRLFRGAREVHLSPKAFELLKLLIEMRPRALSKAELLERLWPGVFVSEASLARVVNQLRIGVGDEARQPRVVRTVHGYGYAFVGEVVPEEAGQPAGRWNRTAYWLACGRREFPLADGEHIVGRQPDAGVWLESPKVSRRHARLIVSRDGVHVEDLASKNGTFVGGARITAPTRLQPGDKIRLGPFTLTLHAARGPQSTETEALSRASKRRISSVRKEPNGSQNSF